MNFHDVSDGRKGSDPIKIRPQNKGKLHQDLGVAPGKPIPEKKLEKALHSEDPAVKKRAVFAKNAKSWGK